MPSQTLIELALLVLLCAAAIRDLMVRRIPNQLLLAGLTAAIMLHLFSGSPLNLLSTGLAGLATGLFLFLPLYFARGMAAGDVKLMAVTGAFVGPYAALQIAVATCCIGGVMAIAIVIAKGKLGQTLRNLMVLLRPMLWRAAGVPLARELRRRESVGSMPYGVAIALGGVAVLCFRHM
jgi:prepilin peptidase CpaA